jgi:hypothetical protein
VSIFEREIGPDPPTTAIDFIHEPEMEAEPDGRMRARLRYLGPDRIGQWDGARRAIVRLDFEGPIDIVLASGRDHDRLTLVPGRVCEQLGARYILMQPEVVRADPSRGWLPLGGVHHYRLSIGRYDSPEFVFTSEVSRDHVDIFLTDEDIHITDGSRNGTDLLAPKGDFHVPPEA